MTLLIALAFIIALGRVPGIADLFRKQSNDDIVDMFMKQREKHQQKENENDQDTGK